MKKQLSFSIVIMMIMVFSSCKRVTYDWENFRFAATPKVTINTESSALPTYQTAKVSFFNMMDPNYATNQKFEWSLSYYDAQGRVGVSSIDVYLSFNKRESSPPAYPITLGLAEVFPNLRSFPMPSSIKSSDILIETVTEFPRDFSFTPAELAEMTGTDLSTVKVDDYFLFKFAVTMTDGTRLVQFQDSACDESRGEPCDCRTGVRFKNQ